MKKNIRIPEELVEKLEKSRKKTEFDKLEDYIFHLLEKAISNNSYEELDSYEDEEKNVKERLKELGYL